MTNEEALKKECPLACAASGMICAILGGKPQGDIVDAAFSVACACRGSLCAWWSLDSEYSGCCSFVAMTNKR